MVLGGKWKVFIWSEYVRVLLFRSLEKGRQAVVNPEEEPKFQTKKKKGTDPSAREDAQTL